ncbi:MAG: Fic family protein [Lewinellaceae bacterium]|nr:Fic family protein [Saprospiraceae bacterium]MCB9341944.1 Fic family protein [Lewinellaceae bacterium]
MNAPLKVSEFRAGQWVRQTGFRSFIPEKVDRQWIINSPETETLIAEAHRKLGELNAFSQLIPDIDFFIYMHKAKEATTSSRIEGTQTRIEEAFLRIEEVSPEQRDDWQEVQNYIEAMNYAIAELENLPLSNRLIRHTHQLLMQGVRGRHKQPGEFRLSQNWIGGATLRDAVFIPPPHQEVPALMGDLEQFLHNEDIHVPELVRIAIAHYQFETIHPFLDGNGRIGRLLITLYLMGKKLLVRPSLYLSAFFEKNRSLYYDNLTRTREQHTLDHWLKFFMAGVIETSESSIQTFRNILILKERIEAQLFTLGKKQGNARQLLQFLFSKPVVNAKDVADAIHGSAPTANSLLADFVRLQILEETTGYQRNRIFHFKPYLDLF